MATKDKRLTREQAELLLAKGGFEKSAGFGAGVHYRHSDGRHMHIRPCGCISIHRDAVDPRGGIVAWARHFWSDIFADRTD